MIDELVESLESGEYMDCKPFKKRIKQIVTNKDLQRWKITSKLYKSMEMVSINNRSRYNFLGWIYLMHTVVKCSHYCRYIIRLLLNTYRLGRKFCSLCDDFRMDSIEHILFECNNEAIVREQMWNDVLQQCPGNLANELNAMSALCRTKFKLNAFYCPYVAEWQELYISVAKFIYTIYIMYYSSVQNNGVT